MISKEDEELKRLLNFEIHGCDLYWTGMFALNATPSSPARFSDNSAGWITLLILPDVFSNIGRGDLRGREK